MLALVRPGGRRAEDDGRGSTYPGAATGEWARDQRASDRDSPLGTRRMLEVRIPSGMREEFIPREPSTWRELNCSRNPGRIRHWTSPAPLRAESFSARHDPSRSFAILAPATFSRPSPSRAHHLLAPVTSSPGPLRPQCPSAGGLRPIPLRGRRDRRSARRLPLQPTREPLVTGELSGARAPGGSPPPAAPRRSPGGPPPGWPGCTGPRGPGSRSGRPAR